MRAGQIVEALGGSSPDIYVLCFTTLNCLGRLACGFLSEYALHRYGVLRYSCGSSFCLSSGQHAQDASALILCSRALRNEDTSCILSATAVISHATRQSRISPVALPECTSHLHSPALRCCLLGWTGRSSQYIWRPAPQQWPLQSPLLRTSCCCRWLLWAACSSERNGATFCDPRGNCYGALAHQVSRCILVHAGSHADT